jgi:hypothetical protein
LCLRIFLRRFLMTEPKWWISYFAGRASAIDGAPGIVTA